MRSLYFSLLLTLAAVGIQAQSIYLSSVDATKFPTIRAEYVAKDAIGVNYPTLSAADFRITDQPGNGNAVDATATITHGCRVVSRDSAATILLIVDESQSMSDPVGSGNRMDLVKDALRNFVNGLNFTTGTQVCIVGFSGSSRIACPWSASRPVIIDSINRLTPIGVTNYEAPFTNIPNIFDEFRKRPSGIPKTAIFLTDGFPNPPIGNPTALVDTVTRKAAEQSIVIHSITVMEASTYGTLALICSRTGGTSQVGTEATLPSMLDLITYSVNTRTICYIEWQAPYGCSMYDLEHTAVATLLRGNNPKDTVTYTAPVSSLARITSSTPILELGSPTANGFLEASVTFTPSNVDFLVRGFSISPSTHFTVVDWDYPKANLNPPSASNVITFRKNVPRVIRVRLTQGGIPALHTALLELVADPCRITQSLRGGSAQVVVVTPNGGEVLTTCDTADIRWSGIPASAPVLIQWSIDGVTWNTIAAAATGLEYRWLPSVKGKTYRIRITYNASGDYTWLRQIGNTGIDTASSVAVRPSGDKLYVTGWFSGLTQFGSSPISLAQGAFDGFCQEFDGDGLWGKTYLVTGESGKNEKVAGVTTDADGNIYIAGSFESTTATLTGGAATFSLRMPAGQTGSVRDVSNMFLAKISAAGAVQWVRYGQGTFRYASEVAVTGLGITTDAKGRPQIAVAGTFISFINAGTSRTGAQMQLGPALPPGPFYAVYDENGFVVELFARTPPTNYKYASKTAQDTIGCTYDVDHFTGAAIRGGFVLNARSGSTDVLVSRRCIGPTSIDDSNADFAVSKAQLTLPDPVFKVKTTGVGTSANTTFSKRICNDDVIPIRIVDVVMAGANPTEFTLLTSLNGRVIQPGTCFDIEVMFEPTAEGTRSATLVINGDCGSLAEPLLVGEGVSVCNLFVLGKVLMSDVVVGEVSTTSPCIIRNTTGADLTISVSITPAGTPFDVNPKGPLVLVAGACFSPAITFDASTALPGTYNVHLKYGLPAECGTLTSELQASVRDTSIEAKDSAISFQDVDWFARRLRTVNDSLMYLTNTGAEDLTVTGFSLGVVNGDITADLTLPATPFLLRSKTSIAIPIKFDPTRRGLHTTQVLANIGGRPAPIMGLARGVGILPAILANGDSWPSTPVLSVAVKTGNVTIRNTDLSTPLRIENVEFVSSTQSDFRWAVPSATLFPATIQPGDKLDIPVQFVPQAAGIRTESVRIYHDAKPGPDPIPPYADTIVELIGIGQSTDEVPGLIFEPTLTCDDRVGTFWIPNPSKTENFLVTPAEETDNGNAFDLVSAGPIVIPPGDSVQISIRFAPSSPQVYIARYRLENVSIPGLYIIISGEGVTTELAAVLPALPSALASALVSIPVTLRPSAPFYGGLSRVNVELLYPAKSMQFQGARVPPTSATIASIDRSVAGRLMFVIDIVGPFQQDLVLNSEFRTLLAADTVVNITAHLTTEYACVTTTSVTDDFVIFLACAGSSRVVNIGANGFALTQLYPSPSSDKFTVRYSTGYNAPATFDVIDAVGTVVSSLTIPEQPSAEYEVDIPVSTMPSGNYILRMKSGHYVESRIFGVVR